MKAPVVLLALCLSCSVPFALAQVSDTDEHAGHHPAASAPAEPAPAGHEHGTAQADTLQASMVHIEALMKQIQEAPDAGRRHVLLAEHLQAMRDQVVALRASGKPMKAAMKSGEKTEGEKKEVDAMGGMMKPGMMKMHEKIEQRVDMLERLLQQALERLAVEATFAPQ